MDDCQACWLYEQALCTRGCGDDIDCPTGWLCIGSDTPSGFVGLCQKACQLGVPIGGPVAQCPEGAGCAQRGDVAWCDADP
jgi:hypothetical protein